DHLEGMSEELEHLDELPVAGLDVRLLVEGGDDDGKPGLLEGREIGRHGRGGANLVLRGLAAVRDPAKPIPLVDREAPHDPAGPLDLDPTRPVYPLEGGEDARIQRPRPLLDVD